MDLLTATFLLAALFPVSHGAVIRMRNSSKDSSLLPSCPEHDTDIPVFYPHPTNCSLFFQCWHGFPYLYSCPAGLYWDQHLSICNWPSQVKCHSEDPTTDYPGTEDSITEDPATQNTTTPEDQNEKPVENKSFLPSCPSLTVYLPHPTNCSLFYECSNGVPYLYSCPAGLYWDQHLSICNWPSQVECHSEDPTTEDPVTQNSTTTEDPATQNSTTTEDPATQNSTTTEDPVPQNSTTTEDPVTTITGSATEDPKEKPVENKSFLPSCPSVDESFYIPHPSNCSLFYECSNGVPYLFSCPAGLYFDSVYNVCNYPSQVKCHPTDQTTMKPTEKPESPTEEPAKPTEEPAKPTEEPAKPTLEPSKPTEEPAKPTEEPDKPTLEPSKPTEEPAKPTEEPAKPTEEPAKTTEEPDKPTVHYGKARGH